MTSGKNETDRETTKPIVTLKDLTFTYEDASEPTLRNINLDVRSGELVLLTGPSGSGKSTFCDIITGVIPNIRPGVLTGDSYVAACALGKTPVYTLSTRLGRVFQDPDNQFCTLFVQDEVAFGPENLCFERSIIGKRVTQALAYVDMLPLLDRQIMGLSGGEKQRLAIACTLATDPEVIVLDEPTSNLDPQGVGSVVSVVRQLKADAKTILLVSKALDDFVEFADQLVVLGVDGALLCSGNPREVIAEHGDMLHSMGVWMPQISELSWKMRRARKFSGNLLPINVSEAFATFGKFVIENYRQSRLDGQTGSANTAIKLDSVSFQYPNGPLALDSISLEIKDGALVAIVGKNGAGKSTLAKIVTGLLKPNRGRLFLSGEDVTGRGVRQIARQVGYVFQYPEYQFVRHTVFDEVAYSLEVRGIPKEKVEQQVHFVLKELDLLSVVNRHPFALSMGQKRRLSVATMLVYNPRILILDEPTFGQDRAMTVSLISLIRQLHKKGLTILLITHDMRLVEEVVDEVIVMHNGKPIFKGETTQLFATLDILEMAGLSRTPLRRLVEMYEASGSMVTPEIRNVDEFVKRTNPNRAS